VAVEAACDVGVVAPDAVDFVVGIMKREMEIFIFE
jgi:hypothetical protein